MSDLRFARELGAEFERLERAGAGASGRRRSSSSTGRLTGRIAMVVALAVPVAIVVVAVALLGISRHGGGHRSATSGGPTAGLALSGGNCRVPARTAPHPPPMTTGPDGLIRAASGRVSGISWELREKPDTALPGSVAHGRLILGGVQYGLCSRQSVPVPFGLVNAGSHAIVYGYVATGGGSYRIMVSAGNATILSSVANLFFFIHALPRPACDYRALTITATSTPVVGMPPDISRSLDEDPTRLTTTTQFGACRPHALVTAVSEQGESQGRSPNAPLATATAQVKLTPPPGSSSRASGWVFELDHDGLRGINLLAFGLTPGRYGMWLVGPRGRTTALGADKVKHDEILKSFDLPADVRGSQVLVAAQRPGQVDTAGTIVLRAALR
jgi:hypothetical protein